MAATPTPTTDRPFWITVMLPCGHCGATGQKEAKKLSETMGLLLKQKDWVTAQVVAQALGIGETNAVNRLQDLLKLELVERRGRSPYEWRARL